ncbi:metal-dependent transcriptional regulator [Alicyclobacillus sendaiensis]|uniref:metal-dependent transcriptional regulator n=1 Tax=Alicyclobacillus sendaiensis TaxID=192387 RepID=UPI00078508E6|nr:metal-dependent transcriptional regulator [Alicyclobacillus sendaiensis]
MSGSALDTYLEAIYVLHSEGEQVLSSRVADYLGVSRPTVSQTLQRLVGQGYVEVSDTRELVLTEEGRKRAEAIIRKHRLLERWLTDVLGLDWADAHVEAARLEGSISPLVESKLNEMLNHPATCPHGNVIPGNGHTVPKGVGLDEAPANTPLEVIRIVEVAEEDLELLRFFHRTGLVPGETVQVNEPEPYAAGVTVTVRGQTLSLDPAVAHRVQVRPKPMRQTA